MIQYFEEDFQVAGYQVLNPENVPVWAEEAIYFSLPWLRGSRPHLDIRLSVAFSHLDELRLCQWMPQRTKSSANVTASILDGSKVVTLLLGNGVH